MEERGKGRTVIAEQFGTLADGRPVTRHTLGDPAGLQVSVLDLGAIVQRLWVPDSRGGRANVVLGFRDLDGYLAAYDHFFGAVVGRFANRIADGDLVVDGQHHQLARNDDDHTLHGGPDGFHRRLWQVVESGDDRITLALVSPDGDQGFPGALRVQVSYVVAPDEVRIDFAAETDAPTVVNLTSHAHFNLGGEGTGTVEAHDLTIAADRYTVVGPDLIPTGELAPVEGTPLDFRASRAIGARIRSGHAQLLGGRGYDLNYVLNHTDDGPVATLADPVSGRVLEVRTDQPGLQLYTGNFFDGRHVGTSGFAYRQGDGVALETQHFPDSPHHPEWPSTLLHPGEVFRSVTSWRFRW